MPVSIQIVSPAAAGTTEGTTTCWWALTSPASHHTLAC